MLNYGLRRMEDFRLVQSKLFANGFEAAARSLDERWNDYKDREIDMRVRYWNAR